MTTDSIDFDVVVDLTPLTTREHLITAVPITALERTPQSVRMHDWLNKI